jgi:HK97 family phage major capsid protein
MRISELAAAQALDRAQDAVRLLQVANERKPERPPFSFVRMTNAMMNEGLTAGPEAEACQEAARAIGRPYDCNRVIVPWSAFQTRDVSTAASGGGYLVQGSNLPAADILRPFSFTLQAGISHVDGLRDNTFIPKTTAKSSITWQSTEATQVTPAEPTISQVALAPKTARGIVQLSRRLVIQSDAEAWIRRELLRTAGTVVDQAVLNGTGASGQPLGVLNAPGLSTQGGTSLDWSDVLAMKRIAAAANAGDADIAFISTPAVRELLEARARDATTGSGFVWMDERIAGRPAYATTDMPSATMLCGPMSQVLFATWGGGITFELNPNDPTLFKAGITQAAVVVSCDVAILCDVAAFTKAASIT